MAQLKNLLVTGVSRFLNKIYASEFVGKLTGNVTGNVSGTASNVTGTVAVSHGGTGATTLDSGKALIGNGTGTVTTRAIRNNTALGTIGWTSSSASTSLLTQNDVAFWNGAYGGTTSNLLYTRVGELKAAATHDVETTVANDAKLPTGAAVQAYVTGLGYKSTAATTSANGLMSSADKTKLTNTNVFYGTCATAAGTAAKVVELTNGDNFELKAGAVIGVKFSNTNSASNVTINVKSTGAKQIWYDRSVYTGTADWICGCANRVYFYMYDGTYWVWMHPGINYNDNTVPSAYCSTAAGTAAKTAICTGYQENHDQVIHIVFTNTNTAASALTLNINGRGARDIYINGVASSSSNYNIPAGSYMAYYDSVVQAYYIRTEDARLPVESILSITNADFMVESIIATSENSVSGGGITNVSFNLCKQGWCALTICGYNCANGNVFIVTMNPVLGKDYDPRTGWITNGSVTLAFGNKSSSTQKFTPSIYVLYVRRKTNTLTRNELKWGSVTDANYLWNW